MAQYPVLGPLTVIPAADLLDLQSRANKRGDTRLGGDSLGKRPGMEVIRDSSGSYSKVIALGKKSSDGWRLVDGSATYTPTNISSWTVGADSTYSSGLLTTDGGNDAAGRVSQAITLAAGTYLISGLAAAEGTSGDHVKVRLQVGTAVNTSDLGLFVGNKAYIHATAAESTVTKEPVSFTFTITETDDVYLTLDLVDEAAARVAGSAYLALNLLEAY